MASSSFHGIIAIFLFVLAIFVTFGNAKDVVVSFRGTACNGRTIARVGDYARAVGYTLDNAIKYTPGTGFDYYGSGRYMYATAYTHGKCNGDISNTDCEKCMRIARGYLLQSWGFHTEGWVDLADCLISFWEFPNK